MTAKWIGADIQELVLLPNSTTGLNAVVASVAADVSARGQLFQKMGYSGQNEVEVMFLDAGYGSVKSMVERACRLSGGAAVPVEVPILPNLEAEGYCEEAVLQRVEDAMTAHPNAALLVFDDVTSNTALPLPTGRLLQLCRDRGVLSLVDAAHSVGSSSSPQLPFLSSENGADFAVGNLHKWACAPRGSAFMYSKREHQKVKNIHKDPCCEFLKEIPAVHPAAAAGAASAVARLRRGLSLALHLERRQRLQRAAGTSSSFRRDFSVFMRCLQLTNCLNLSLQALPHVIRRFWGGAGVEGEEVMRRATGYQSNLLAEAVDLLSEEWGTSAGAGAGAGEGAGERKSLVPVEDCRNMALVKLPALAGAPSGKDAQDALFEQRVECPVKTVGGELWVRISVGVYNERADYAALALAISKLRE